MEVSCKLKFPIVICMTTKKMSHVLIQSIMYNFIHSFRNERVYNLKKRFKICHIFGLY